jgi:hypothetical protein
MRCGATEEHLVSLDFGLPYRFRAVINEMVNGEEVIRQFRDISEEA